MTTPTVRVGRVYDPPSAADGTRVLVDRLWPRGLTKAAAALDVWCRSVAPSTELRKWFGHDPGRRAEFIARYEAELRDADRADALAELKELAQGHPLTLLTAATDLTLSHAPVLARHIEAGQTPIP
ncbi:MAG: DUF488 domain-containing protein [Jatrophihabitans sp.]|uniref:DUF488 domain-containing protein n=1 Tax=Jatrophihabitans sp. TaxID=1932789 RepID=UPI0039120553